MSNIAEGFESRTVTLYLDYLGRAKASCGEVRSQLYIAADRRYLANESFEQVIRLAESTSQLIHGLMRHLKQTGPVMREEALEYVSASDEIV